MCCVHHLARYVSAKTSGERLFGYSPHSLVSTIRRFLVALKFQWSGTFTLKGFRAGRATDMAKKGSSVGTILNAGEWRSSAFLRYVDEDAVDLSYAMEEIMASGDESED